MQPMTIAAAPPTATAHRAIRRSPPTPMQWRMVMVTLTVVSAALGYLLTRGDAATRAALDAGAELTRLLQMMTLLKVTLGAGALALVSLRFRFPIATPLAASYIAAGAVMAAGPGVMWNIEHIGIGALLLHGGLAALFCLAWIDGGTRWSPWLRRG